MKNVLIILALVAITSSVAAQTTSEKVLVPIRVLQPVPGANGSLWFSSLLVRNNSPTSLILGDVMRDCSGILCVPAFEVIPGTTYEVTPSGGFDRPGAVMTVPAGRSRDLTFTLRIQDLSRQSLTWGTEIPVVRETDLQSGMLVLLDVPTSPSFRNTLRIYDIDGQANDRVVVRLFALDRNRPDIGSASKPDRLLGEQTIALRPPAAGDAGRSPSYADVGDFTQIAPFGIASKIGIEIEPLTAGLRIWAFISVTDNESQHVTIITPR